MLLVVLLLLMVVVLQVLLETLLVLSKVLWFYMRPRDWRRRSCNGRWRRIRARERVRRQRRGNREITQRAPGNHPRPNAVSSDSGGAADTIDANMAAANRSGNASGCTTVAYRRITRENTHSHDTTNIS